MFTIKRTVTQIAFLTIALLVCSAAANAALIPVLQGVPVPSGGNFIFNYNIDLQQDERVDPAATAGATCAGPGGTLIACNPAGTFVTIYDIAGFVGATAGTNWGFSAQLIGLTPSLINGTPFDATNLMNVTFMYTGPVIHANGLVVPFTGFQIISSLSSMAPGVFSFQATKDTGASAGNTDQGSGPTTVPAPSVGTSSVPEPATMVLLGAGLLGLAMGKRILFRRP